MVNTKIRLIIFFTAKDGEALYSQQKKKIPGADGGSDHELLIAKFRLKLKKVGITTRLFRYDINQIPCNYTLTIREVQIKITVRYHVILVRMAIIKTITDMC